MNRKRRPKAGILRSCAASSMMLLLTLIAIHVSCAFMSHHAMNAGRGMQRGIEGGTFEHHSRGAEHSMFLWSESPSLSDTFPDETVMLLDEEEEDASLDSPIDVVNGTSDGYVITKQYTVPLGGFSVDDGDADQGNPSLSTVFSPQDMMRLRLEAENITLPAALMLLDPDEYPTQSRARKVIRQRSICICRNGAIPLGFNELGKVIARVYPGDSIGFQRRAGSDYYATQGVPYRPPPFDLPVIYEDDHMAIVNKPAGVVVYRAEGGRGGGARGGGHGRDTLLSALPYVLKPSNLTTTCNDGDSDDQNYPLRRPQPVHRLDRPTSGLMVIGKTKAAVIHLAQQFEFRKARKTYTAILNGSPGIPISNEDLVASSEWNTIDYDLEGKSAITQWRVTRQVRSLHAKNNVLSLVELKPKTGRYHQLRRHMAWVCNSPLVGDSTYDEADDAALRLRRRGMFLCSNEIELEHPYYNTPSGRQEWTVMGQREGSHRDAIVREDQATGTVMVNAKTALPDKFESFLRTENARATKFMD